MELGLFEVAKAISKVVLQKSLRCNELNDLDLAKTMIRDIAWAIGINPTNRVVLSTTSKTLQCTGNTLTSTSTASPPKRKRGRPRKSIQPPEIVSTSDEEPRRRTRSHKFSEFKQTSMQSLLERPAFTTSPNKVSKKRVSILDKL